MIAIQVQYYIYDVLYTNFVKICSACHIRAKQDCHKIRTSLRNHFRLSTLDGYFNVSFKFRAINEVLSSQKLTTFRYLRCNQRWK